MQLSSIDANLLVILQPLLRTQSVSQSARLLGLSPSATSHALSRLRDLLGDELLVRAGRGLVLTERGQQLLPLVNEAVWALEQVLQPRPGFEPRTLERTFHLLYASYFDWLLIPPLDRALRSVAPQVNVHGHITERPGVTGLRNGELDLMVVLNHELPSDLCSTPLFEDSFVCLVRVGHPCLEEPFTVHRYASLEHVLISPLGGSTGVVDQHLKDVGLKRKIARTFTGFMPAPYLISQSDYVLTLPKSVATLAHTLLPLVQLEPPLQLPTMELRLAWHQRHNHDPAHRWFRQLVKRTAANFGATPDTWSA